MATKEKSNAKRTKKGVGSVPVRTSVRRGRPTASKRTERVSSRSSTKRSTQGKPRAAEVIRSADLDKRRKQVTVTKHRDYIDAISKKPKSTKAKQAPKNDDWLWGIGVLVIVAIVFFLLGGGLLK